MSSIPIVDPGESPRDRAARLVDAVTHSALAELLRCGVHVEADDGRVVATAYCKRSRQRLVVYLVHYTGLTWEPAAKVPAVSPCPLRDVEAAAVEAAPGPAERPISIRALARRAGYKDTGHWREAVNQLLERGLLVRIRGGVRRAR